MFVLYCILFDRHIAIHTNNQRQCYCDHCGRGFVDKRNLIQHLTIHEDIPISSNRFRCVACGANYCEQRLLNYHIRKEHLNLNGTEPGHVTKNFNETWLEKVKDTKNYVEITKVNSNKIIIKKSKVKSDMVTKKNDKKSVFQQYIASIFATKDNYYSKAICDYCNKEMLKKSIVPHIRERHLKLRRFHCKNCDRTYNRHYQLCMHNCEQPVRRRRKVKDEKTEENRTRRIGAKVEKTEEKQSRRHGEKVKKG